MGQKDKAHFSHKSVCTGVHRKHPLMWGPACAHVQLHATPHCQAATGFGPAWCGCNLSFSGTPPLPSLPPPLPPSLPPSLSVECWCIAVCTRKRRNNSEQGPNAASQARQGRQVCSRFCGRRWRSMVNMLARRTSSQTTFPRWQVSWSEH